MKRFIWFTCYGLHAIAMKAGSRYAHYEHIVCNSVALGGVTWPARQVMLRLLVHAFAVRWQ